VGEDAPAAQIFKFQQRHFLELTADIVKDFLLQDTRGYFEKSSIEVIQHSDAEDRRSYFRVLFQEKLSADLCVRGYLAGGGRLCAPKSYFNILRRAPLTTGCTSCSYSVPFDREVGRTHCSGSHGMRFRNFVQQHHKEESYG
jgi:hypothetical protein